MGGTIAQRLAAMGAELVLNDVNPDGLAEWAERLGAVRAVLGDATERAVAEELIGDGCDILVNCAGGSAGPWIEDIEAITDDDWDATLRMNLRAMFLCTKLAIRGMRERGGGKIVNIASTAWADSLAPYSVAKAGVVTFTRGLALHVAQWNINANAVAPGLTETRQQFDPALLDRVPLHRFNEASDIANAVAFLCSEEARNISGQLITVAGGRNPAA